LPKKYHTCTNKQDNESHQL